MRGIVVAALLSGFWYLARPAHQFDEGISEEEGIARHLAHGQGFLSPFDDTPQAPPTSWCPPVYPVVISIAYRLVGERTPDGLGAIVIFNIFCRTVSAVALFMIGRELFGRGVGVLASAMFLAHPMFLRVVDVLWDNYLALAIFLWLVFWAIRLSAAQRIRGTLIGTMGAALGVLLLTNTAYALTCPAILLLATARQNWRRRAWLWGAAAVGAALLLLPWTVRNERTFGRLFLVRGNVNVELWLAHQPWSCGWMTQAALATHPSNSPAERQALLQLGETNYFARCGERFAAEVRAAPSRFLLLCGERVAHVFISDTGFTGAYILPGIDIDRDCINAFFALAGLAGAWTMWRLKRPGVALLGIALLAVAPYLITQVYNRYAMPLRAILVLFAAFLVMKLARWNAPISK